MALETEVKWKKPRGPKWFRSLIEEIASAITTRQPLAGIGIDIQETIRGRQISVIARAGGSGGGGADVDYDFQLIAAPDESGPKVLIRDGVVYGPNNDSGTDPAGMPADDSYTIVVGDNQEIWVGMTWDLESFEITSAWIESGDSTPDNGDPDSSYTYVTLGHVSVDYGNGGVPKVFPTNEVLGDIIIEVPPSPDADENTVPELVLVTDTDDGRLRWIESVTCDCVGEGDGVDGGSP